MHNFLTDAIEIKNVFKRFYPQLKFKKIDREKIESLLYHDKKNTAREINFVLLENIGTPKIDVKVSQNLFNKAFDFYESS